MKSMVTKFAPTTGAGRIIGEAKTNPMDSRGPRVNPDTTGRHREEDTYVILRGTAEGVLPDQTVTRDHTVMEAGLEANPEAKIPKVAQGIEISRQTSRKAS